MGRIYCYMDQAKYTAYNPELKCVHVKNILDVDPYCELAVRKVSRGKKSGARQTQSDGKKKRS